jgi:serine/threonine-protein kinase
MTVPTKLGQFELLEEIGHGGIATVYRALDPPRGREVALKVLDEDSTKDPELVGDFLEEGRHAVSLCHPHIGQVYRAGEAEGRYYIVMELLRGCALDKLIAKQGLLSERATLQIAIEVAEALRAWPMLACGRATGCGARRTTCHPNVCNG